MYKKPNNKQFKLVFDSIAKRYDQILNTYSVNRRIEFFKINAKGKCLEVGAGSGEISKVLLKNHEVVATDISPKMIEVIRKKIKINAVACDAEKLPFKNNSFDTIIAAELIYYLDHPQLFIKEANRILKRNGIILLSSASKFTQIYDKIRDLLRILGMPSMYFNDLNRQFMSLKEIKSLLYSNGFKIKEVQMTILIPFAKFDALNRIIEKTFLRSVCSFIFVSAKKVN